MSLFIRNPGSFKDPSGTVFSRDGKVYRSIFAPGVKDFESARDAGIHDKLIGAGLLLPHEEVGMYDFAPEGTIYCLTHPPLPMVSYPWEWTFSMLKDAALIHLEVMEMLVPKGFWLRDASALNVQYDGSRVRLVDTLSIGRRVPESPWIGYRQFCSHFLAPLALAAYCDIRTLAFWRTYIDGYPLDLVIKMLPFARKYRPGIFLHLYLHAYFQRLDRRKESINNHKSPKMLKVTDQGLIGLIRSLRRTIARMKWRPNPGIWAQYKAIRTYHEQDIACKSDYVAKVVQRIRPKMVWDLGGNTGEFSLIAASHGAFVVCMDEDPVCTEYLYREICRKAIPRAILPLTMNFANSSPGLGWDNRERPSLGERGSADLVLALALIHHLVFTYNVPLPLIAEWFSKITNYLLVEFIPPNDPMVQIMVMDQNRRYLPYSLDLFQSSFGENFYFIDQIKLNNGRILFLCKCK